MSKGPCQSDSRLGISQRCLSVLVQESTNIDAEKVLVGSAVASDRETRGTMAKVVECVRNFSEGRMKDVVDAITSKI